MIEGIRIWMCTVWAYGLLGPDFAVRVGERGHVKYISIGYSGVAFAE